MNPKKNFKTQLETRIFLCKSASPDLLLLRFLTATPLDCCWHRTRRPVKAADPGDVERHASPYTERRRPQRGPGPAGVPVAGTSAE